MKATLDHIGIAINDLPAALAFYRDALGLEIAGPEEVASERVRAHFVPTGGARLELLEGTTADSPVTRYVEKRGPGLHHITLRVDDIAAALAQIKAHGARLIDERPRRGAGGSLVAFIHPSSAQGVLVELKQTPGMQQRATDTGPLFSRFSLGDLELISLSDGYFRLDGGAMFGVVPKTLWEPFAPADDRNRVRLSMRPLVVRGRRTLIIDAGLGDKERGTFLDIFGVEREQHLDHALEAAGVKVEDIDLVLATHLHFDHAGGFTTRDASGRLQPRFPRARYVIHRGEWEDAAHPNERTRASYRSDNFLPLMDAGVVEFIDQDQTIMPGVRVRHTGGHTPHHQIAMIDSGGKQAAFVADLIPSVAHMNPPWTMGFDVLPVETLTVKKAFIKEAVERQTLILLEHDLTAVAGHIVEDAGRVVFAAETAQPS
jgi:methylmalonyl-CoA epimerase